jgi:hypothetical protein
MSEADKYEVDVGNTHPIPQALFQNLKNVSVANESIKMITGQADDGPLQQAHRIGMKPRGIRCNR